MVPYKAKVYNCEGDAGLSPIECLRCYHCGGRRTGHNGSSPSSIRLADSRYSTLQLLDVTAGLGRELTDDDFHRSGGTMIGCLPRRFVTVPLIDLCSDDGRPAAVTATCNVPGSAPVTVASSVLPCCMS